MSHAFVFRFSGLLVEQLLDYWRYVKKSSPVLARRCVKHERFCVSSRHFNGIVNEWWVWRFVRHLIQFLSGQWCDRRLPPPLRPHWIKAYQHFQCVGPTFDTKIRFSFLISNMFYCSKAIRLHGILYSIYAECNFVFFFLLICRELQL
jgi:hypothetical protein